MFPGTHDPPKATAIQSPTEQFLQNLRDEIARLETARFPSGAGIVSSGCQGLDHLLPRGGFRRGTLVEWLSQGEGTGRETLVFLAAREACREGGAVVVLDPARDFYPPASLRLGIPPELLIVVQPANPTDHLWALDQSLRCAGVAAVLAKIERLDGRTFRRLQLAVEQGGGLGLLLRPDTARREPSWAEVRLAIEPVPIPVPSARRRLKIEVLRVRGGARGECIEVEIDDEARAVHLAPRMAHPAARRR
ncbi:MAG: hypothetical protein NUV77_14725, partial [Thermoguttaceae bacterium]|nr:hypothetical protein [Thermoguttaceae bacterium]